MRLVLTSVLALALSGTAAPAATYNIFEAGTLTLLGTFEAPLGGGLLTAASITVDGALYDVLGSGSAAPVYDALNSWITGNGDPFGAIFNSAPYMTVDINDNMIACGVNQCVFSLTDSSGGGVPAEWYLDYVPMIGSPAAIDFGNYEIAPIPLPAAALLLAGALAGLAGLGLRKAGQAG